MIKADKIQLLETQRAQLNQRCTKKKPYNRHSHIAHSHIYVHLPAVIPYSFLGPTQS